MPIKKKRKDELKQKIIGTTIGISTAATLITITGIIIYFLIKNFITKVTYIGGCG